MNKLIVTLVEAGENSVVAYLLSAIAALASVIVYLYVSKEKQNKEWKDKIEKIYERHNEHLKEANSDLITVIEKYNKFQDEIKDLIMPRRKP